MNCAGDPTPLRSVSLRKIRILVVDDDELLRRTLQSHLVRQGALVETVGDGIEGLRALLQRDYDVLVVDIVMPKLDGASFARQVREMWPWISIILISAFSEQQQPHAFAQLRRMGAMDILQKPLDFERLCELVADGARKKKERITTQGPFSAARVHEQIVMLRRFCEQALSTDNLHQSFVYLSQGLGLLTTSSVVGILHVGEERLFTLTSIVPVSPVFLKILEMQMLERYALLSGETLSPDEIDIAQMGEPAEATGPEEIYNSFTLPIMIEGRVRGLATLANAYTHSLTPEEITFLYHAGAQLATVLVGLNRMRLFSTRDGLTGLLNRRGMEQRLGWLWDTCKRRQTPLTIMIMDLDLFKMLNDTHGHLVGDQLLQEFAALVQNEVRASDIIARYGGDEIVLVLPDLDESHAEELGMRLISKIREHVFCEDTHRLHLTASAGAASVTPSPHSSREEIELLLAHADRALYAAKRAGRDCWRKWNTRNELVEAEVCAIAQPATHFASNLSRGSVLLVEDEEPVRTWMAGALAKAGYTVQTAKTVSEGTRLLRNGLSVDVLLTDLVLPDGDGMRLIVLAKELADPPVRVIATGHLDKERGVMALHEGIFDIIEKPFNAPQLLMTVRRAMEHRRVVKANLIYQNRLEALVRERSLALSKSLEQTRRSYEFVLEAFASMLDARERNTARHSVRVAKLAVVLAREMGLSETEIQIIRQGALLHDIGKIAVPDYILLKEGPLTDEEWKIMRRHPETGYNIIKSGEFLRHAAEIVHCHQERFDGTGYPRGLKGSEIPLGARIFAVADAYDALRSRRPYKAPLNPSEAILQMLGERGKQFDPAVVDGLVKCQAEIESVGQWSADGQSGSRRTFLRRILSGRMPLP